MSSLLVQCDCINPAANTRKHHTTPRTNHPTPEPDKKLLAILNDPGIQQQLEDLFLHLYNILRKLQAGEEVDVNAPNERGEPPLYLAAEAGREAIVALLLEYGADPNQAGKNKALSPLFKAIEKGRVAMVHSLLEHGADPNAKDQYGSTPLHMVPYMSYGDTATASTMARLLVQHGANLNVQTEDGYKLTPLHNAIQAKSFKAQAVAEVLLQRGADPNTKDAQGYTPLHTAVSLEEAPYYDLAKMIRLLLERGASLEELDGLGRTPLELAGNKNPANKRVIEEWIREKQRG